MKKKTKAVIIGVILYVIILVCYIFMFVRSNSVYAINSVSDNIITDTEYQMIMEREKSDIYAYFTAVYGIQPGDLIWNHTYHGEIPEDMLTDNTNKKILENNFVFLQAEHYGLIKDSSFEAFVKMWNQEKQRRKYGAANDEAIYGPVNIDMYEYYDYYLEEVRGMLKNYLWDQNQPSNQELQKFMETKLNGYKKRKSIEAKRIYINTESVGMELYEAIEWVYQRLKDGDHPSDILKEETPKLLSEDIVFDESTYQHDSKVYPELREEALKLKKGEFTKVIDNGASFDIAIATKVNEEGYYSLEEVFPAVKHEYIETIYQKELMEWKKQYEIDSHNRLIHHVKCTVKN